MHTDLHGSFQAQFGVNPKTANVTGERYTNKTMSSKGALIHYDVSNQLQSKDNSHKVSNKTE